MLLPGSRFDLNFTTIDSTGANTAPTGTPTWVLLKNGAATAVTGNATMTGSQGYVTTTIPGDAVAGDRFAIRVTAVVSGLTQEIPGPSESIADLAAIATAIRSNLATELGRVDVAVSTRAALGSEMTLTSEERLTLAGAIEAGFLDDMTGGTFLAGVQAQIQALFDSGADVPVSTIASVVASAVRSNLATELSRIDATVSSRLSAASYTAPPSIAGLCTTQKANELLDAIEALPSVNDVAGAILADPTHLLLTTAEGWVTSTSNSFVLPIVTETANRITSTPLQLFTGEGMTISLTVRDKTNQVIDLSGRELIFRMARAGTSVRTVADLRSFEMNASTDADWDEVDEVAGLTGDVNGVIELDAPEFATQQAGPLSFSLRDADTMEVLSRGILMVQYAA